jgi:carboxymethylenebutenolidase
MEDHTIEPAYIALPERGAGPGVVVLHAWWGLNDFFKRFCDRLAQEGFVAAAPDLYDGAVATTIDEAKRLMSRSNSDEAKAKVVGAVEHLRAHPAVRGNRLGAVGFSMGGGWAILLSALRPDDIAAVVVFYGTGEADYAQAQAAYLCHFAEADEWEPLEYVRQMEAEMRAAGKEAIFHLYAGAGHWFFEDNRPDAYDAEAAELAWERTITFLHRHLGHRT